MSEQIRIVAHISEAVENKELAVEQALTAIGLGLVHESHNEIESDPRRVDTANLRNSVTSEVDGETLTVGTPVEYAIYVHEGTRRMQANRFIRNAFMNNLDNIQSQLKLYLSGNN